MISKYFLLLLLSMGISLPNLSVKAAQTLAIHNCLFCNIINKAEPAKILFEDNEFIIFDKPNPGQNNFTVNVLICPKRHVENFKTLDELDKYERELPSKMIFLAQKFSKRLSGEQSYRLEINNGAPMQGVFHLHMHFKSHNFLIH